MGEFVPLTQAVIDGDRKKVLELVNEMLANKATAQPILSEYLIPGMVEVGRLMAEGEYFIPEVLKSAKSMNGALELLEPLLLTGSKESAGCVVIGTVDGDIHDIGKNLVCMLLKGNGFEVIDLGVSVSKDKFIEVIKSKEGTLILGMSTLITPTLAEMAEVIQAVEKEGLRSRVKIMIGGAPVTKEYADSIGADGMAPDGPSAVTLAKALLST